MEMIIKSIRDWSEVWALFIPLAIILTYRQELVGMKTIILYVIVALILNLTATIMFVFHRDMPSMLKNNNILYNLHSFARVAFFSMYIILLRHHRYALAYKFILACYLLFVILNFWWVDSPFYFSSRLFTAESIVLLIMCLSFFIRSMLDDSEINWLKHPSFLVCTGIALYEAINFFIFLFFYPLLEKDREFGKMTMTIHHIVFTLLCVMLALALYRSRKQIVAAT